MLKINKHQKREPIGGHHVNLDGQMFRADTFDALVKKVREYRVANGISVGSPDQEILGYYKRRFPYIVVDDGMSSEQEESSDYLDWRRWVSKTWGNPPKKLITTKEAKDRWAKCLVCPFNTKASWKETDESAAFARRAFMLRRGVDVPEQLGFCSLHRADLSVFTFIEAAKSFSEKKAEGKESCWVE